MGVSLTGFCAHIRNRKLTKNSNDLTIRTLGVEVIYTVSDEKKHVTTFYTISLAITVRLQ